MMTTQLPCVQIFKDLPEKVCSVSLKRDRSTGIHVAVMRFQSLASLAHFLGFRKYPTRVLHLADLEGKILIQPTCIKLVYDGPEGTDIRSVECELEVAQDDHWQRFMRFLQRYVAAHGLVGSETEAEWAIADMDESPYTC